jgi:hypothetical protein
MDSTCSSSTISRAGQFKIKDYKNIITIGDTNGEAKMLDALQDGPIAVAIYAGNDFQQYKPGSGLYSSNSCNFRPNHAVVIVGYGVDSATGKKFWKVRNSWGTTWGNNGYILMERGVNMCYIEKYLANQPILESNGSASSTPAAASSTTTTLSPSSSDCLNITTTSSNTGIIQSAGYPQNYPNSLNCSYVIEAPLNYIVRLEQSDGFNLETTYDTLEVAESSSLFQIPTIIGTFSGTSISLPISSSSRYMYLRFKTDSSLSYSGFRIRYSFQPSPTTTASSTTRPAVTSSLSPSSLNNACLNVSITSGNTGIIQSAGYPLNYPNNLDCSYVITAPVNYKVRLEESGGFNLETTFDNLEIRNGADSSASLLGTYSGPFISLPISASTRFMYLRFKTDSSVSSSGFSIRYSFQPL